MAQSRPFGGVFGAKVTPFFRGVRGNAGAEGLHVVL